MTGNRGRLAVLGLLLVCSLAAYWPALSRGGYIWDDDDYVSENPLLVEEGGLGRIWFEPKASPQYYPLVFTSFLIERQLLGFGPRGQHVTNVLLQVLNAFLLYLVLKRLGLRGALIAALIFALHPVMVESVAWITERKNLLSGCFVLLSLRFYLVAEDSTRAHPRAWYLALGAFVLALLSKTVAATLGPSFLLLAWWRRGRIGRLDLRRASPFFVLGAIGGIATAVIEVAGVQARGPEWDQGVLERILIAGRAVAFYAGKLAWPDPLLFNYPRWVVDVGSPGQWLYPLAVLAFGLSVSLAALRGRIGRGAATAFWLFVGTLFPALGFLNVYPMRYSFVADHFQYLAAIALIVPFAHHLDRIGRPGTRPALVAILVVCLGALSHRQCRLYENQEVLWRETLAGNPGSWIAANNLGMLSLRAGRIEEGRALVARALELAPQAREVLNNAGTIVADLDGDEEGALDLFRRAMKADPSYQDARTNLALMLVRLGRPAEAIPECDEAISRARALGKDYPQARWIKGRALHEMGRDAEALVEVERALARLGAQPELVALRDRIRRALGR
ncbi:MAG: tetratricopeptide repeat protein [Planctomycetes bacterium]|nr:tetratricopeptide repeat protein [Planctomycetota bacterium]